MHALRVVVVSAIDAALQDDATAALVNGRRSALPISYRLDSQGTLTRSIGGLSRAADAQTVPLLGCCLSCSVRADLATTLPALQWEHADVVVVSPPPAMDPVPIVAGIQDLEPYGDVRAAAAVTVITPATLPADLFGTDLLAERNLAVSPHDRRSVGEVLARQVETADVLLLAGDSSPMGDALLEHLVGSDRPRLRAPDLNAATDALLQRRTTAPDRADLRRLPYAEAREASGVWTLDLATWKPFHPERLLDSIERLGSGPLRGRGVFWLASRPTTRCAWDGAGGQLSVGPIDAWDCPPFTRLVITGISRRPARLRKAFEDALLSDRELAQGLDFWLPVDGDGWETWLGPCGEPAFSERDDVGPGSPHA